MEALDRYLEYKDDDFDATILKIHNGTIKAGRYSHLVKIDKNKIIKGKEFFNNGNDNRGKQG